MKFKYVGKVPRIINGETINEGDVVDLKQDIKNENFEKVSSSGESTSDKKSKKKEVKKDG